MTGYQSKRAMAQDKLDSMEREALKLALDALENHTAIKHPQQIHYRDKAIAAIKEALAQPSDNVEQEPWRESASDYERGFIDGRQKQAQSSVDKAVNRMAQPAQERNFCERCGKRLGAADHIHTCTPPQGLNSA